MSDKTKVCSSSTRQKRQNGSVGLDALPRITRQKTLQSMRDMAFWIAQTQRGGYRYIARFTRRGFGWWQHVGSGNFKSIKPTVDDYETLKNMHAILQDASHLDAEMMTLLLEMMEARGKFDAALSRLVVIVRKKGTSNV